MEDLISIIIPVYNVEEYIERCIKSLIEQTYHNIQFIFVNDGTQDNCVEIINRYGKSDPRIELYQKENGGLSSARNFGVQQIRGKYVCFVDSDDWVSPDYVELLKKSITMAGSQISCAGFDYAYADRHEKTPFEMKDTIIDKKSALLALCQGKWMTNYVWNKMYDASLFEGICFEEGRCFEDIYIMHQVFAKADKISCISDVVYHYFMRQNSIVHDLKPQNDADIFIAYRNRYDFLEDRHLKNITLKYCAWSCFKVLYLHDRFKINRHDYTECSAFWNAHPEIAGLGLKYLLLYKTPRLFAKAYQWRIENIKH